MLTFIDIGLNQSWSWSGICGAASQRNKASRRRHPINKWTKNSGLSLLNRCHCYNCQAVSYGLAWINIASKWQSNIWIGWHCICVFKSTFHRYVKYIYTWCRVCTATQASICNIHLIPFPGKFMRGLFEKLPRERVELFAIFPGQVCFPTIENFAS